MKQTGSSDFYCNKAVLVTGASGFLGSNLVEALSRIKCRIRRLSRSPERLVPVNGAAFVEDIFGDVSDSAVWGPALGGIDVVFHLAAQTGVREANDDPAADLAVNVLPMLHMLDTCRRKGLRPAVLFAGTTTEVGITARIPVDETHPDAPVTVYDLHKLMAENYLKYYAGEGVVRGASLRLANVYGPGPRSGNAARGVLNVMIGKALEGETLAIYGKGNHIRDYVYVQDAVTALLKAGACIDRLNGRHCVVGSGRGHSIAEMVNMVAGRVEARTGRAVSVKHIDPPGTLSPIEKRDFVADTRSFSSATGWQAHTLLAEGIDLTIDFLAERIRGAA